MSRKTDALSVEQALETALRFCRVTEPELCAIGDCADRILAEDMRAAISSPPFRRSAMDGFAVRSEDLCGASGQKPVILTMLGCNDAGSPVIRHIGKGETAQIMTGGVLPEEADAVVKQEIVELRGQDTAVFSAPAKPGDCFSPIGEDLQEGEILAYAGETVDASALAGGVLHRGLTPEETTGVLTIDGFGSALSGILGGTPVTSYSENVGLTIMTKVVNRNVARVGGIIMVIAGFFPPVGRFFGTVPKPVIGGILLMVLGQILVSGVEMIAEAGFSVRNKLITAISLSVAIGFTTSTEAGIWSSFPLAIQTVFSQNVVAVIFAVALVLNLVLPKNMD